MAYIRKRKDSWQAIVRKKGVNTSASFSFKKDALEWATRIEREIDIGEYQLIDKNDPITLKTALSEYLKKVTPTKKGADRERNRILLWQKHELASKKLTLITGKDLAEYRDKSRGRGLSEASIRLELMLLSSVFNRARKDWGYTALNNPVEDITLPKQSNKRERRLEAFELEYFLKAIPEGMPRSKDIDKLVLLDIETGMRQSEILGIMWEDVFIEKKYIRLDDTKSGDPRNVPLSRAAIEILTSFEPKEGKIFTVTQDALIRGFQRICALGKTMAKADRIETGKGFLENLRFHDLRHEAASRWASRLETHELCKMFGWKTPAMALRYYHPDAGDIAKKLG